MLKFLEFLIVMLLVQNTFATLLIKKNLCTVTINSSEEADIFKKRLSPKEWNFIELTPDNSASETKNWFQAACKKNISCDILIISGHFAGSFFGKTKFVLPIEELESLSCNQECSGILNNPKEVFLFGCNTLASKEKDLRSPEEYLQVLRDDGFTPLQASQVVSFRYSGFGESFKNRMSAIFPKTPNIYGFSSVGPSGKTIYSMLDKYLLTSQSDYKNFSKKHQHLVPYKNEKLYSALPHTSLTQTTGLFPRMKVSEEKPYCYVRSNKINRLNKLKYIENLLETGNAIQMISHIEEFIHSLKNQKENLTTEENNILLRLSANRKIKNELTLLLKLKDEIYIPLKVHILNTLKDLNLISNEFVEATFNQLIDLQTSFSLTRKDLICSSQFSINIPLEIIPKERWNDLNFIISLICLKPKNIELHLKILEQLKNNDPVIRGTIVWFFYGTQTKNFKIQMALAQSLLTEKELYVRQLTLTVLRDLQPDFSEVHAVIAKALIGEHNEYAAKAIIKILEKVDLKESTLNYLKEKAYSSSFRNLIQDFVRAPKKQK